MKKYILWLNALAFGHVIQAQAYQNIPPLVKTAFEKKYPNQIPEWEKEKNRYVAKFTEHGRTAVVHYNRKGGVTETAWYIEQSELPEQAQDYINKYYTGKFFDNVLKLENPKGILIYKARLNGKELVFNGKGIFIKKEKQKD